MEADGQRAVAHQGVVEALERERIAEPARFIGPELQQEGPAQQVGQRIGRAVRVPGHLGVGVGTLEARVLDHEVGRFLDPDLATVEAFGAILEARITSPPAPGTTLGGAVLRLADDTGPFVTLDDAYYRRDTRDIPLADESAQTASVRVRAYGDASDVYQLFQTVTIGGSPAYLASTTLYRFPSAATAEIWLDTLIDVLGENPYYGDPRLRALTASPGDQRVAIDFVPRGGSPSAPRGILVAIRIGADVGRVQLVPNPGARSAPFAAVETLAALQAECLGNGLCPGPVPFPSEVAALPSPGVS